MVVIKIEHQAAQVPLHFVSMLDAEKLIYSQMCCAVWFGEQGCVWDKVCDILFMANVFVCQMGGARESRVVIHNTWAH